MNWDTRPDLLLPKRDNTAVSRRGDVIVIEQEGDGNHQDVYCVKIHTGDVPALVKRLNELAQERSDL